MAGPPAEEEMDFHHPYEPYGIQKEFMQAVYRCCEQGKIGVLESPTGTGKSLSLICGSLTWLRHHKRQLFDDRVKAEDNDGLKGDDDDPDWMRAYAQEQRRRAVLQRRSDQEARLAQIRKKEDKARDRYGSGEPPSKRQRISANVSISEEDGEAAFLLDDYQSDDEKPQLGKHGVPDGASLSIETRALLDQLGMGLNHARTEEDGAIQDETKIFYCSRTHSQITQFINELRRVKPPPSVLPKDDLQSGDFHYTEELKHVTLASRKNLCINEKVSRLGTTTAINDRCLEIQQPGTPANSKCPHLPKKDNEVFVHDFRDHALAKIRDIEDFGRLGRNIGICPYYASRAAIKPAEIVTLPYQLLLQKSAREALNISLKDHVVIIDEAHNLLDAIANMHSVSISLKQLQLSRAQLSGYLQKFRNRLKGKNRVYVTQLVRLLDSLMVYLQSKLAAGGPEDGQAHVGDLMAGKGVDQVNLYKLMHYLQESKLARKVERYAQFSEGQAVGLSVAVTDERGKRGSTTSLPVLTHLQSFLLVLTYPAAEGRFFFNHSTDGHGAIDALLKYQLLDPTFHFREVVQEARAVILAGGTMSPMSDYTNHLFHYLTPENIETLSCGHVIPISNLFVTSIVMGPNTVDFDFSYGKRQSDKMILELGHAILQFSQTIPDGLVVFFPSYAYLNTVIQSWQTSFVEKLTHHNIWHSLSQQKRIFLEPKSTANVGSISKYQHQSQLGVGISADKVLAEYTEHIRTGHGALLFAVIGGSLSEGINFSDSLGRGVVVVGLPFPNAQSAEWKAKMEFIETRINKSTKGGNGLEVAREFYENACMRAVNQSVGRAIRHKDDYAAILLLDHRYGLDRIHKKLPQWIRDSFTVGSDFTTVVEALEHFFKNKKND